MTYMGEAFTNNEGDTSYYNLSDNFYKAKTFYQGKEFWSNIISYPDENIALINISLTNLNLSVFLDNDPLFNQAIHCYTNTSYYLGNQLTNELGEMVWSFVYGSYKCKIYYQQQWLWTDEFFVPDMNNYTLQINRLPLYISVLSDNVFLINHTTHLYAPSPTQYIGFENTNNSGIATFDVINGSYKAKTFYRDQEYWSSEINSSLENNISINIPLTEVNVNVDVNDIPFENQVVYCYTQNNYYLGENTTDSNGKTSWKMTSEIHKCKTYYEGNWIWTDYFIVPNITNINLSINATQLEISSFAGDNPLIGQTVHLYTDSMTYIGPEITNGNGNAYYNVAENNYKAKIFYQGKEFWSPIITFPNETIAIINISLNNVAVNISANNQSLINQGVHCYTDSMTYLGEVFTDEMGRSNWELSNGNYQCKTYYNSNWYWTNGTFSVPNILNVSILI